MKGEPFIIEVGTYQLPKHGNMVSGDCFLSKRIRGQNRVVAVLSDGLGSGIKANVLSSMTASMALNFRLRNEPLVELSRSIMDTLPVDSARNMSYSTFSIVDVDFEGETTVVEYGNPSFFVCRNGNVRIPDKEKIEMIQAGQTKQLLVSTFFLQNNDRLMLFSDGITQSGMGSVQMPFGWECRGVEQSVLGKIYNDKDISASQLARWVVKQAEHNDLDVLKDDASCAVFYRRAPRRLLLCSGPPYNENKDHYLAETVAGFEGTRILCGGTTAKIISRELGIVIESPSLLHSAPELPPASVMSGIDLVTEGILTLSQTAEMLETMKVQETEVKNPASDIVKRLLEADVIKMMIGTKINVAHQDPNLPVELEIRRNVVKRIARTLEEKFLKQVEMVYI
jgi:hypothetical protein